MQVVGGLERIWWMSLVARKGSATAWNRSTVSRSDPHMCGTDPVKLESIQQVADPIPWVRIRSHGADPDPKWSVSDLRSVRCWIWRIGELCWLMGEWIREG